MEMPVSEIYDRTSILLLKAAHGQDVWEELDAYWKNQPFNEEFLTLLRINAEIWKLEADIRNGKDQELGFYEVGKRAIQIREWNRERIAVKNRIAKKHYQAIEVKTDHASVD